MPQASAAAPHVDINPDEARQALAGRAIGPHVALGAGLPRALERLRAVGAGAAQVFVDDPTAWRRRAQPAPGVDAFRRGLEAARIGPLAIHASYLVNLASPDVAVQARSVEVMVAELRMGERFGAGFVNVHLGSHRGTSSDAGIDRAGELIARILEAVPPGHDTPMLVLENSAGQGDSVGVTMAELGGTLARAERHGADSARVGVCLDTAHLWAAGHAVDTPDGVDRLVGELETWVGPDRLAMIHLNDSRTRCGSRVDRHEHVGAGGVGPRGMRALLLHPLLARVPAYLETPGMESGWDAVNMDRVRRLLRGDALPDLPPAAFRARGDRR